MLCVPQLSMKSCTGFIDHPQLYGLKHGHGLLGDRQIATMKLVWEKPAFCCSYHLTL